MAAAVTIRRSFSVARKSFRSIFWAEWEGTAAAETNEQRELEGGGKNAALITGFEQKGVGPGISERWL